MRGDMKVVTHPDKAPALDFLTRTSVGPFVDTGIDVTLRSRPGDPLKTERVYLSEATVIQLAQLLGISSGGSSTAERDAQLIAQGKIEGMKEALGERLDDVVRDLGRVLGALDGRAPVGGGAETL